MLHGILDPQPGRLVFALFDDRKLLRQEFQVMHPRDASQVPGFVADNLAACGKTLQDVPRWTFGCGPGSFTFLRVVAALGAGWAAANPGIRFRCIPGALAMAAKLDLAPGESAGVLYDGRNKELLCFGVRRTPENILEAAGNELILNSEAAKKYFTAHPMKLAAFACDEPVLKNLLDGSISFQTVEPDPAALADAPGEFDNDTDKMCYIRPAVSGK